MRYFMSIIPDRAYVDGKPVPRAIMDAMGPYIEQQVAAGALVSTGGLASTATGARLSGHSGRVATTDGPFAEAREVIGGYAVFEAPDRAAALVIAADFVQLHIDNAMPDITVELREIAGGHNI